MGYQFGLPWADGFSSYFFHNFSWFSVNSVHFILILISHQSVSISWSFIVLNWSPVVSLLKFKKKLDWFLFLCTNTKSFLSNVMLLASENPFHLSIIRFDWCHILWWKPSFVDFLLETSFRFEKWLCCFIYMRLLLNINPYFVVFRKFLMTNDLKIWKKFSNFWLFGRQRS